MEAPAPLTTPVYQEIEGMLFGGPFVKENVLSGLHYEAKADDVFLVTYPKGGTTWGQYVLFGIFHKGQVNVSHNDVERYTPFLEMYGAGSVDVMKKPGAIKTHLPFNRQPYHPDAKYIYIVRNPKDTCVSFYFHTKNKPGYRYANGEFNDFFERFIKGEVDFGDYFDHVVSWWKQKDNKNILFVTYEDMIGDIRQEIKRMAKFLGDEYIEAIENDPEVLENIVKFTSFDAMKKHCVFSFTEEALEQMSEGEKILKRKFAQFITAAGGPTSAAGMGHIRKGVVNDWKNYFDEAQSRRMDAKFWRVAGEYGIDKIWKNVQWIKF